MKVITALCRELGLKQARPDRPRLVKQFFGFELDRIYFRQLILRHMDALENRIFSDHNPLLAKFSCTSP